MKVWMWPKSSELNLYSDLLSDSLGEAGLRIEDLKHGKLMLKIGRVRRGDAVHLHWVHHAYQHRIAVVMLARAAIFLLTLLYLRLLGVQTVWTIHNLYPHQVRHPRLERLVRTLICRCCAKLVVASESIKRKAAVEFGVPERKLFVVKHGHYVGVYKSKGKDVRKAYGIGEEADVVLFLGAIKAYKGVEDLVASFNEIKTRDTHLIVAGKADERMTAYLRNLPDTENIVLDLRFVPNEDVADLVRAADVMALPYKEITTSGSAILGLSFRKLVVMPDNEFIDEYFKDGMVARYDPAERDGLTNALKTALNAKGGRTKPKYDEALGELDWRAIAERMKNVYQGG